MSSSATEPTRFTHFGVDVLPDPHYVITRLVRVIHDFACPSG